MYELIITKTFANELKKIDKKERKRIEQKLFTSTENPWDYWVRLKGHPLYKIRIGKYRVIAQIALKDKKINLLSVKHRKKAYRKL